MSSDENTANVYFYREDGGEKIVEVTDKDDHGCTSDLVAIGMGEMWLGLPSREPEFYETYRAFKKMPDIVLHDSTNDDTIVELTRDHGRGRWIVVTKG